MSRIWQLAALYSSHINSDRVLLELDMFSAELLHFPLVREPGEQDEFLPVDGEAVEVEVDEAGNTKDLNYLIFLLRRLESQPVAYSELIKLLRIAATLPVCTASN